MTTFSRDPLFNAVQQGIKRGIDVTLENECFGSAIILIYSAIDTMAFIGMPGSQEDVRKSDFVEWADRYIKLDGPEQIAGEEFYGARCATLHSFGVVSRLSRAGKVRMIGYGNEMLPVVIYRPDIQADFVMLSIQGLRDAVFSGIDTFLVHIFSDPARKPIAEGRLRWLLNAIPIEDRRNPAK